MDFKDRLTETLKSRGFSQADLAREMGVSAPSVSAWCSGLKPPKTANLIQIAELLRVTPAYLAFGETTSDIDDDLLDSERERYQRELVWHWRETPPDGGREYGNAAGYAFEPSIATLTRESAQNITDAKLETSPTVDARFTVIELTGERLIAFMNAIRFDEVREHLEAARLTNHKASAVINQGLQQLADGRLTFIRIDDFNACGLNGKEFESGMFMAVVRNLLDSQKGESAGGSFGLGKATLWSSSQFGLVLMNSNLSVAEDGHVDDRFIGRIDLPWHAVDAKQFAGPGWLGVPHTDAEGRSSEVTVSSWGNRALAKDLLLARPTGPTGTSFLIVGAYDASGSIEGVEDIADEFAKSLADSFWPAMVDRPDDIPARLRAIVRAERDGELIFERYVNPAQYQPAKVAALARYLEDDVVDLIDQPGDVVRREVRLKVPQRREDPEHPSTEHDAVLIVAQADDADSDGRPETAPGTVTFLRGNQMVIEAAKIGALPIGARSFHAIVLAGEAAGDGLEDRVAERFLRAAEPPAHNKWTGTSDVAASYVRGGKKAIDDFVLEVRRQVRDLIRQPSRDSDDGPDALKELLRIVPPTGNGRRPRVRSVKNHYVNEEGAWVIAEATLALPPRPDGLGWVVSPVLRFGTESGAPLGVDWAEILPLNNCELMGGSRLVVPAGARAAKFSATSDPSTHPVSARLGSVTVDVRVHASQEIS